MCWILSFSIKLLITLLCPVFVTVKKQNTISKKPSQIDLQSSLFLPFHNFTVKTLFSDTKFFPVSYSFSSVPLIWRVQIIQQWPITLSTQSKNQIYFALLSPLTRDIRLRVIRLNHKQDCYNGKTDSSAS